MVIGMQSKELIKSIILFLLVLMSAILTYMTWNFSPDLANVDKQDNNKKKESNTIGNLETRNAKVITPSSFTQR